MSGVVTQPLGRKKSMQIVNIPFFAAWLIFHYASKVEHLYLALCITGLSGGLLEAPVLTYVAEITQPHLRGMLSATSSMTIIFGVFCQFLLGTFLNWRSVALVNLAFPIIAALLLFIVPESPHWLVQKNRLNEAQKSLAWLRGWTTVDNIEREYKELCVTVGRNPQGVDNPIFNRDVAINNIDIQTVQQNANTIMLLKKFGDRSFLIPCCLVSFAFFLGHFSGMTTLQTFAVQIFQTLQSPINKYYATLLLGIVELSGSLVCVVAVHYVGKRPLTFLSTVGCGICFLVVATYAYSIGVTSLETYQTTENTTLHNTTNSHNPYQWLPTTFLIGSAFLSHIGIRLLPWILIGEVFPTELRSIASGIAGGIGYIFGFAANKVFLNMIHSLTLPGTFWFYGALSLTGTIILYNFLPETEGRTLHDIQLHFSGQKKIKKNAGVFKNTQNLEIGEVNHAYIQKPEFTDTMDSKL